MILYYQNKSLCRKQLFKCGLNPAVLMTKTLVFGDKSLGLLNNPQSKLGQYKSMLFPFSTINDLNIMKQIQSHLVLQILYGNLMCINHQGMQLVLSSTPGLQYQNGTSTLCKSVSLKPFNLGWWLLNDLSIHFLQKLIIEQSHIRVKCSLRGWPGPSFVIT